MDEHSKEIIMDTDDVLDMLDDMVKNGMKNGGMIFGGTKTNQCRFLLNCQMKT